MLTEYVRGRWEAVAMEVEWQYCKFIPFQVSALNIKVGVSSFIIYFNAKAKKLSAW